MNTNNENYLDKNLNNYNILESSEFSQKNIKYLNILKTKIKNIFKNHINNNNNNNNNNISKLFLEIYKMIEQEINYLELIHNTNDNDNNNDDNNSISSSELSTIESINISIDTNEEDNDYNQFNS